MFYSLLASEHFNPCILPIFLSPALFIAKCRMLRLHLFNGRESNIGNEITDILSNIVIVSTMVARYFLSLLISIREYVII